MVDTEGHKRINFTPNRLICYPHISFTRTFRPPSRSAVRAGFVRWPSGGASVYFGRYEPDLTRATIGSLKAGGVFFDIGANVGYYSVLASRLVGETGMVVAFEPLVRNIYYLYYHVMLNRCSNVVIVPAACADISGAVPFLQGRNPAEGKILSDWGDQRHCLCLRSR